METSTSSVIIYKGLGVLAIFGLILSLIGNFLWFDWAIILSAIFKIILVIILSVLEFAQTPTIVKGFSFMFYFLGRGIFYFILGFITMGVTVISLVGGILIIVVGIVYIVLHFANHNHEPEYMSFHRYQRLTSGISHDLPTTAAAGQQVYPVANQIPLSQHNVQHTGGSFSAAAGQYNVSPIPVHSSDANSQEKTEV